MKEGKKGIQKSRHKFCHNSNWVIRFCSMSTPHIYSRNRVPTGIKIFRYFATVYGTRKTYRAACLWALGFVSFHNRRSYRCVIANSSIYIVLHDTYYAVAHFHYVLSIAAVFAIIGGIVQWFPLFTELTLNPKWLALWCRCPSNANSFPTCCTPTSECCSCRYICVW